MQLTTFVHPAKAYRLQYPAHWEHLEKDDDRSCGFGPRDRDDVGLWITIMPVSIDTDRLEHDLPKLFQQAIHNEGENVRRDLTLRHFGLKADIINDEQAGQFWIIAGGDLVLSASSQVRATEREIWNPQFQRLMASLEITRERELLLRQTADHVYKRLRELHPEQDYRMDEDGICGRDHRISLANVYQQVAASPERRQGTVERFVEGLAFFMDHPPGREQLDDVRDNIVPVLKPGAYIKPGTATERLVSTAWLGDVIICYAIRTEKVVRLLTDWDLNQWSIGHEALHKVAIGNLTRRPWPERLEGTRQSGGRLIIVDTNDNLDASRLLHPELHRFLSGPLGSPFYAGVPNANTLVAFSAGDNSLFDHVLRQIQRDYDTSAYPITPQPFLVTSAGVTLAKM
jgi:uncharacterized protein YtpQ (UPF0354 family)